MSFKSARRALRLRIAGRALVGLVVLVLLVIFGGAFSIHRANTLLRQLLREFATSAVAERSDSIYSLSVEGIHFNWALRHVNIDSAVVTTDSAANARHDHLRPVIRLGLYGCTLAGVNLHELVLGKGLSAQRLGCGVVTAAVVLPVTEATAPSPSPTTPQQLAPFLVVQQGLKLPASIPRIHIRFISFPHTSFVFAQPRWRGGVTRLALEHLEWHVRELAIDPADPAAAKRPLFSKSVDLTADKFTMRPDSVSMVEVGSLKISLTDSTLRIGDVHFGPTVSDGAFARQRPWRRSRVRLQASAIAAAGVDFGRLLRRGGVFVRRVDVDSFIVDIWSDKRLPLDPHPSKRLSPQAWFSDSPGGLGIDTLAANGRITYRELREGHEKNGVLTFTRMSALARNVRHVLGRHTYDDPMTLTATAYIMNAGRLDLNFTVPLDAPGFAMAYSGKLGAMPATALNDFIAQVFPARISGGDVDEIRFHASVRGGVAHGELTPLYHGLAISVTGQGSSGILGAHGSLARLVRGVAGWYANQTKLRQDNPEQPGQPPRLLPIAHVWDPYENLPGFLWVTLRDPLLGVIKK